MVNIHDTRCVRPKPQESPLPDRCYCGFEPSFLKGVHNLRHTFGRRLRSAGIPLETRKMLLGHANGDITTHYSAAELSELINAAESIVCRGRTETPNLMLIGRKTEKTVGKVSETKKGLTGKIG